MENNNEWNRGLNGVLQGLGSLAEGFIVKGQKNDANATYNEARTQLMNNYDKLMKFNTDKLELANTNPEVNTEGVKNDLYSKLLGDYENSQQKLQSNPYGQTSAKVLEDYYNKLIPTTKTKYEIIKGKNDSIIAVNPFNPKDKLQVQDATPVTETWAQVPGSKSFTSEENGKYYVTQMKQSKDGETKLVKTELNKEDYESWKKYNPTFEDKEAIKLDNKVSFKMSFPNLGRGGTKRTKAEIDSGVKDVMGIMNKAKNNYLLNGTIPTADMQSALSRYNIDISQLSAGDAKQLFEKFAQMTPKQIEQYIQDAFFND